MAETDDPRGCGKTIIHDIDWATPAELGIEVAKYETPKPKKCNWKDITSRQRRGRRKCKEVCDGYCPDCEDYWADGLYLGFTVEEITQYFTAEEREE